MREREKERKREKESASEKDRQTLMGERERFELTLPFTDLPQGRKLITMTPKDTCYLDLIGRARSISHYDAE